MTCFSCNQEIPSDKASFIVCPKCGAVNISSALDKPVYTHHSGVRVSLHNHSRKRLRGLLLRKKLTSTAVVSVVAACLLISLVAALNIHPEHHQTASNPASKSTPSAAKITHAASPVSIPTPQVSTTTPRPTTTPAPASKPVAQPAAPQTSIDTLVATINQQLRPYGVTATLTPPNNAYTYSGWSALSAADVGNLQQFSTYLSQEFSKYPANLVINSGLKTIGLVKNLQVSGGARAAAPAPSITGMLYDVDVMTNAGSAYAREVISHEYWHYLDYKMRGSYTYDDPQWDACNPPGFTYGSGGISAYGADSGYVAAFHPRAGFITAYSEYGIQEDRAEMFGWLIYSPSSVKSLNDSGINCKINRLTAIVHQLSPAMSF